MTWTNNNKASRLALLTIISCAGWLVVAQDNQIESKWIGLQGRELAAAVGYDGRPVRLLTNAADVWKVIYTYATDGNDDGIPDGAEYGMLVDYFGPPTAWYPKANNFLPPESFCATPVVPDSWWNPIEKDANPTADLHNLLPSGFASAQSKASLVPGIVSDARFDNGYIRVGIGMMNNQPTDLWEPPVHLRGDIARILMYAAVTYPSSLWHDRGWYFFDDGQWPGVTSYGRELLLQWHRDDPVDDAEVLRDIAIAAAQGNRNQFVCHPELAEYLWGNKAGQIYGTSTLPDNTEPDGPNVPADLCPLKATYSISQDITLDLYSPYISPEARWTVDDKDVHSVRIELNTLGVGRHELRYSSATAAGRLIITVTQ